ncbi:putative membrane protein [Nymphaea thermarum]|nr:putative membrane protein [Nymphaea thermarum]
MFLRPNFRYSTTRSVSFFPCKYKPRGTRVSSQSIGKPAVSISCCYQNSRPTRKPNFANFSFRLPITPFCILVPLVHSFRNFLAIGLKPVLEKWALGMKFCEQTDILIGEDKYGVLECGGIGMALLSTSLVAKAHISPVLATLAANPTFVSGLFSWAVAQSMKFLLHFCVERKWNFQVLVSSGGMPSSHTALCTALTTSVALCHGISDSLFPVCLGFSLIVMYDATGVRRHAGMQAEVLNMIVEDLFKGHPCSERKLKELLGHTPSQVIAGAFLGMLISYLCCHNCLVGI